MLENLIMQTGSYKASLWPIFNAPDLFSGVKGPQRKMDVLRIILQDSLKLTSDFWEVKMAAAASLLLKWEDHGKDNPPPLPPTHTHSPWGTTHKGSPKIRTLSWLSDFPLFTSQLSHFCNIQKPNCIRTLFLAISTETVIDRKYSHSNLQAFSQYCVCSLFAGPGCSLSVDSGFFELKRLQTLTFLKVMRTRLIKLRHLPWRSLHSQICSCMLSQMGSNTG